MVSAFVLVVFFQFVAMRDGVRDRCIVFIKWKQPFDHLFARFGNTVIYKIVHVFAFV